MTAIICDESFEVKQQRRQKIINETKVIRVNKFTGTFVVWKTIFVSCSKFFINLIIFDTHRCISLVYGMNLVTHNTIHPYNQSSRKLINWQYIELVDLINELMQDPLHQNLSYLQWRSCYQSHGSDRSDKRQSWTKLRCGLTIYTLFIFIKNLMGIVCRFFTGPTRRRKS